MALQLAWILEQILAFPHSLLSLPVCHLPAPLPVPDSTCEVPGLPSYVLVPGTLPHLSCKPGARGLSPFLSCFLSHHSCVLMVLILPCVLAHFCSQSPGMAAGALRWPPHCLSCHHTRLSQSERAFQLSLFSPQRTVSLLSMAPKLSGPAFAHLSTTVVSHSEGAWLSPTLQGLHFDAPLSFHHLLIRAQLRDH